MNKKEWIRIVLIIVVASLLGLVLIVGMHFQETGNDVIIEKDNHEDLTNEIIFVNNSSMSEQDIRVLVEEKRTALKEFFREAKYYNISDVSSEHTKEDNDKYIVVGESFLNTLKDLLSIDLYGDYWNEFTEIVPKSTVDLKERVYKARKDLFDDLYSNSAIAMINLTEEILLLEKATDETITALINIKLCEEDSNDFCKRDEKYYFILDKVEDTWKIAEFTLIKK